MKHTPTYRRRRQLSRQRRKFKRLLAWVRAHFLLLADEAEREDR